MAVQLDHTIVNARDKHESATFWAEMLGLRAPTPVAHFVAVDVSHDLSFDFANANGAITPQHYAFRVNDTEFDAIFSRITDRQLPYWADPRRSRPYEIRTHGASRGFYFEDPSGHFLEVLTQPSAVPAAVPITTGFNHVATLATDLDRHAAFYERVFGAKVAFRIEKSAHRPRMFILDLGGDAALNVVEVEADEIVGERGSAGGRGAIDHFGIAVESLAALEVAKQRLIEAGADVGEIQRLGNEWSLFFRDVDGMELEVCAPADVAA